MAAGFKNMSVIKANRKEGKLNTLTKARDMCIYTITICKNEKNFPKRNRWIITQPIINEALGIMSCIRRANAVDVTTHGDYTYRRSQQIKAYSMCEALLSLIEVAYGVLDLESTRVEYWTGLVVEVENYLQKWTRADKEKHKDI